ncbi:D123-domain-containing protein [Cytidiella melzeri]|nr:D123-domain-containing protein [Cytidiella melzeri]
MPKAGLGRLDEEDSTDNSDDDEDEESREPRRMFAFPELDAKIRVTVKQYGAVFPKLYFSSPRDAAWMLPPSFPLKCTAPSDVYSLLKPSDFILHDLTRIMFSRAATQELNRSRELRCFVRREILLGISQRDPNYYDFWNEHGTQQKVVDALTRYWEENIKGKWEDTYGNYPLLFEYEELLDLLTEASSVSSSANHYHPVLKVVDSRSHPAAARNAHIYQHNMVPMEALALSGGRNVEEFAEVWQEQLRRSTKGTHSDDES